MQLDDKTIMNLASQLGIKPEDKQTVSKVKAYEKKERCRVGVEIMKIKDRLTAANIPL